MNYLILNNINGNSNALDKVLELPEKYDKILILGNITGKSSSKSRRVLEILFKMIASKVCTNLTCGQNDLLTTLKIPNGAKAWLDTFLPISSFKDDNKGIILLTGTVQNPYSGIPLEDDKEYWNDDKSLDIIIQGNHFGHYAIEKKDQLIIYPGSLYSEETKKLQYLILSIENDNIECSFKEIIYG